MPRRTVLSLAIALAFCTAASAQPPGQLPRVPQQAPVPPAHLIAATVDGKPIPELAVYRAIGKRAEQTREARTEVLNYLIDNILVDQYLDQMQQSDKTIVIDAKEVDAQVQKVKAEIMASGKKLDDVYRELFLTESELWAQVYATLRWEKFIQKYGSEKTLREYFDGNKAIFDGSSVRARHILLTVPPGDGRAAADARNKLARLKKQVEENAAVGVAEATKLDNLDKQKLRMKLTGEAFALLAAAESNCPTKSSGGDLGWFPRNGGGRVPESFAKATFALKPWQISDVVETEAGLHLILCVEYRPGVEPRFEDIRDLVRDVYADKMREAVVQQMRPKAKIVINPAGQ